MRIGVVIPAFNAAGWIGDAIASVAAQTHSDWQLVVVDDGSTDGTSDVADDFAGPQIRLIQQQNGGVSRARNRGIAELLGAATDALLFLDADDWLAPDALSRLAAALAAEPNAVAAAGPYAFVGAKTIRTPFGGDLLRQLLIRNLFANGGHLLVRSEVVQKVGGFLAELAFGEDWEFWVRIALQGPFATIGPGQPVLFIRQHSVGAYQRLAVNPASFSPCMHAIFSNPALLSRFSQTQLLTIRGLAEAENHWIIGRELIRHGQNGKCWLRRSVLAHPTAKRLALLALGYALPLLPYPWRGPFQPYSR